MGRDKHGQPRDWRGRFTAERTTETTHRVTERFTVHHDPDPGAPGTIPAVTSEIRWAPGGWDIPAAGRQWREQRRLQWQRTWDLLAAAADDGQTALDEGTLRQAVTMLRALPGASCMEAEHGRSI
jgi:hypothetical protein